MLRKLREYRAIIQELQLVLDRLRGRIDREITRLKDRDSDSNRLVLAVPLRIFENRSEGLRFC